MKGVAVYFGDEWNAGRRFIREQFPAEHDSSSGARTGVVTVETITESGRLQVNYFGLMFTSNVC